MMAHSNAVRFIALIAIAVALIAPNAAFATNPTIVAFTTPGGPYTWTVPAGVSSVEVLVIAGGGGGISSNGAGGGGGGAGGLVYNASYLVTPAQEITVTVGNGGVVGLNYAPPAGNGNNSVFGGITALGGGGGGYGSINGSNGGSGGGGGYYDTKGGETTQGNSNGTGYGNNGGNGSTSEGGGGGGGAGVIGNNGDGRNGGNGGNGTYYSQFSAYGDTSYPGWFAGGGAGAGYYNTEYGLGGKGGGGGGGCVYCGGVSVHIGGGGGMANTGGGGGSGWSGGEGGSGIVIIKYTVDTPPSVTLISPADNTNTTNTTMTFTCNATDDNGLTNLTLHVWNSTEVFYTNTTIISGVSTSTNWTIANLLPENYTWNCLAYDNNSQPDWGDANYTLKLLPIYSAPTDSFTSGLTFNGSVDGNLSGGSSYTTNQNITFLDTGSGRKYFMTAANFSGGNVNVSSLTIEATNGKIAVNAASVTGLYGTHTLWLPKTGDSGVYVCPNATSVSEVSSSCSNVLSFAGPFPQTLSGITVSVDDSYWKVEGLTGSGAGEKGPIQSGNLSATVLATAVITMVVDTINFGSINVNQTLNATTAFGSGFQIDNDGNADINITIAATALWTRSPYDSTSDKYRFACTTFNGTSCPSGSQTSWTNMTIGGPTLVTANLPSASRTGVDIEITAPTDEPAGTRSSTVTLSASLA
jgi:hypothetical protein